MVLSEERFGEEITTNTGSSAAGSEESNCPPDKIVYDSVRAEYVCLETGEVIADRIIDDRAEWRAFTPEEEEKRARTGGPITSTVHDMGLSTVIDYMNRDASGKSLVSKRHQLSKLRKWQSRIKVISSIERNLVQAMNELDRITSLMSLPSYIREEAARIYREAVEKGLVRGRSIEAIVAAAVYLACRIRKVPRTLDEIAECSKVERKDIARCYRLLLRELGIKVTTVDPIDFVYRIASALGLPGAVVKVAIEVLKTARERGITGGKDPVGLAAAAVYYACEKLGIERSQKEIASVAGVTEVTVRNRYRELVDALNLVEVE
jgi:transcription initiation factor TFIIB